MNMPQPKTPPDRHSAGEVLRQRREEKELSITQVADGLRLDSRVIQALEKSDYASLPAPLYVRGYLRGYARLLNMDPEPIVARFNSDLPEEPPEIIPEVRHPIQTSSSDRPVKAVTYLVTLTMVVLIAAWWQSNFVVTRDGHAGDAGSVQQTEAVPPGLPYSFTIVRHPDSPFYRMPDEEAALLQSAVVGSDATAAAPVEAAVPDAAGPDRILMQLSADSWIEVADANGRKIYANLARKGDVVSLVGTAPFSVLLGYAQGVNITFNDQPFEPAYSRSGIARFKLGE